MHTTSPPGKGRTSVSGQGSLAEPLMTGAASPCSVISLRGAVVLVEETTKDDQRVPLDLLLAVSAGWLMLYWSVRAMRIAFASRLDVRPGQAVGVGGCRGICKFIKVARARTLAK